MSLAKALLENVCDITMGQAPSGDTYNTDGEGLPLIAGAGDFGDQSPEPSKFTTSPTKVSRAGDIILCIRATIGDRNWSDAVYCLGRGVAGLSGKESKLDQRYLWHWLGNAAEALKAKGRGATFLQVNKADIGSLEIPLPPLSEQRRIAAILDKADALRAKRRETIAKLDGLAIAMFYDASNSSFGSPISIGKPNQQDADRYVPLLEVAKLATGHTPSRGVQRYWGGQIPWMSLTDIRRLDGRLAEQTEEYTTAEGIANSSAVMLPKGTVCFSRTASVGFATILGREMSTSQDFVNWICGERIDPYYLMAAFRASKKYLVSNSSGSTHKTIYFPVAERFHILLPDISKQARFGKSLRRIWHQRDSAERQSQTTERLFKALQQRAFSGAL